jgi:hypothetical protein
MPLKLSLAWVRGIVLLKQYFMIDIWHNGVFEECYHMYISFNNNNSFKQPKR